MTINFNDEAALPVAQRDNEFRDVVKYLAATSGAVKSYVAEGKTEEETLEQVASDKRKMAEAGNELTPKVTIRTRTETLNDGKSIKVYMTATKKIERKRKTESTAVDLRIAPAKPAAKPAAKK